LIGAPYCRADWLVGPANGRRGSGIQPSEKQMTIEQHNQVSPLLGAGTIGLSAC
jgi:hypothetical protein